MSEADRFTSCPRERLVMATAVLFLLAGCGENKFEQEVENEKLGVGLARETVAGGYELITTAELKKLVDEKKEMLVIDAMPYADSYKQAHIPGAKQFLFSKDKVMEEWDAADTGGKTKSDYEQLLGDDKDKLIVVYCGFVKCLRSHNAAIWAKRLGYKNVKRHPGGINAWKGAGYATAAE